MFHFNFRDDVCVLSAIGTAAIINPQFTMSEANKVTTVPVTSRDNDMVKDVRNMNMGPQNVIEADKNGDNDGNAVQIPIGCSLCHIPQNKIGLPVNGKMKKCAVCK